MPRKFHIQPPPRQRLRQGDTEIRFLDDGSIDEVVAPGFHLEQMDHDSWWMAVGEVHVRLFTRNGAHILANCVNDADSEDRQGWGEAGVFPDRL